MRRFSFSTVSIRFLSKDGSCVLEFSTFPLLRAFSSQFIVPWYSSTGIVGMFTFFLAIFRFSIFTLEINDCSISRERTIELLLFVFITSFSECSAAGTEAFAQPPLSALSFKLSVDVFKKDGTELNKTLQQVSLLIIFNTIIILLTVLL